MSNQDDDQPMEGVEPADNAPPPPPQEGQEQGQAPSAEQVAEDMNMLKKNGLNFGQQRKIAREADPATQKTGPAKILTNDRNAPAIPESALTRGNNEQIRPMSMKDHLKRESNAVVNKAEQPQIGNTGDDTTGLSGERLYLPTKGIPYPDGHPCKQGWVLVRPITTREEEILVTERLQRQGIAMDMVMQRCILTKGINTLDLVSGDRMQILFYLRAISYGAEYEFDARMPSTGTTQRVKTDVSKLDIKMLDDDFVEPIVLQVGGNTYEVRLNRGSDEQAIIQARLRNNKKLGARATEIGGTESLKRLILSVNGDEDPKVISQHIENMIAMNASKLRKAIADIAPGPQLNLDIVNEENGEIETIRLQITESFFRPSDE